MKDSRIEKIKQHYTITLNGKNYKVLKHKIDTEKSLLTIRTKVFGQNFPMGKNILASLPEGQALVISWEGKNTWKDETVERWAYTIIS